MNKQKSNVKYQGNRRGAVVVIALVLIALLAAVSTTVLQQMVRDSTQQQSRWYRVQSELLRNDVARDSFRERFAESSETMTAGFAEACVNPQKKYEIVVDPAKTISVKVGM